MASSTTTPPLGKYLASTEKKTRDKAIRNLSVFLSDSSRDAIPKPEMDKLWKGIFYCFWMSDKPLVQQALASELAELLLTITTTKSSLAFLRGFWETTVREWSGIDRLRIDKYYMLVRRFVNATFRLLIRADWEKSACDEYSDILSQKGGPLCSDDNRVPTSLAYHLSDIYVEELDKALSIPPIPPATTALPAPLSTLLTPFFTLAARTRNSVTYKRLQSALFDPLLSSLSPACASDDEDQPPNPKRARLSPSASASPSVTQTYPHIVENACVDDPNAGAVEPRILRKRLLRRVFEVASEPETRDSNRRKMYALWKDGAEDEEDSN